MLCLLVALTGSPALAAPPPDPVGPVRVAAVLKTADGGYQIRRTTAPSAREGKALAERWRGERGVVDAGLDVEVRGSVDPYQASQWGLPATRAIDAWAVGDAAGQTVAVVDSGADLGHPDLAAVLTPGYDLVDNDATPQDDNGHGTHVAGIIGAVAGNGIGVAGVAQRVKIMPVRVLDATGSGYSSAVAAGIRWAADHGATVVNLSLGSPDYSSLTASAVDYALARGITVVAASGNEGMSAPSYPAALPGVIAVGAVDRYGVLAPFSNTGSHLALAAPGVDILSTLPGGYGSLSGTSMAAPFVAGAAAVVRAAQPGVSATRVLSALQSTARDLGPIGLDPQYGAGRLDIFAARSSMSVIASGSYVASASSPDVVDLVARGADGAAMHRTWTPATGLGATTSLGRRVLGAPASASRTAGTLDMFARGEDSGLYGTSRGPDGWSGWSGLGGVLSSRPSATAGPGGRLDVVARGTDGAVWHRWSSTPGAWSAWESLGGQLLPGTAPATVWTSPGRYEVVAVGTDRRVWRRTWTPSRGWTDWTSLDGQTTVDVTAAAGGTDVLTVVVRGTDLAGWSRSITPTASSTWASLGGVLSGGPSAAAVPGTGRVDVFALGTDGRTYVNVMRSGGSGWRVA